VAKLIELLDEHEKRIYQKIARRFQRNGYSIKNNSAFLECVTTEVTEYRKNKAPETLQQQPFTVRELERSENYWRTLEERQKQRERELSGKPQPKTYNPNGTYKTPCEEKLTEKAVTVPFDKIHEVIGYTESHMPYIKEQKKKKKETLECWENIV